MDRIKKTRRTLLIGLLLACATLAALWPVVHNDFINYDDPEYVTLNPHVTGGFTWENVKWAITSGYASNWHPLTWLSHILDAQLFGLKAGGHHFVSLLLHAANSVLLFLALNRLSGALWRSALVAALFALHPLHVESVAWIAERKDVLSGFFFMLTICAYARYVESKVQSQEQIHCPESKVALHASRFTLHASRWYVLALVFFACGLMSKPMLVTLPFVLLLLDYWPLGRLELEIKNLKLKTFLPLLREKLPFFLLTTASCAVTLIVQRQAMVHPEKLPFMVRLGNAVLAQTAYLRQAAWPTHLGIVYPYPTDLPACQLIGAATLLLGVTGATLWLARRRPYLPMGWFWYLGMLVPVIGLVQVGAQARADRYTYLPLIGLFVAAIWGLAALVERFRAGTDASRTSTTLVLAKRLECAAFRRFRWWLGSSAPKAPGRGALQTLREDQRPSAHPLENRIRTALTGMAAGVLLVALGVTTHRQARYWQNSHTIFGHTAKVIADNAVAWECLGIADLEQRNPAAALTNLARALECAHSQDESNNVTYYIGAALQIQGDGLAALPYLEKAMVTTDLQPERNYRLGLSLTAAGRLAEAEAALKLALEAKPHAGEFQLGMAALLFRQGQNAKADELFRKIVVSQPELVQGRRTYANFLLQTGRPAEAEAQYAAAVRLDPLEVKLRRGYAAAFAGQGKTKEAIGQLEEALQLEPTNSLANFDLAELLSGQGRSREAVAHYEAALAADPNSFLALNNLAWLLATTADAGVRNGARAVELAERACEAAGWKAAFLMGTLAAAYAEAGRFPEAVAMAEKARDRAQADKEGEVAKRNEELLELYRSGKAYHEGGEAAKR